MNATFSWLSGMIWLPDDSRGTRPAIDVFRIACSAGFTSSTVVAFWVGAFVDADALPIRMTFTFTFKLDTNKRRYIAIANRTAPVLVISGAGVALVNCDLRWPWKILVKTWSLGREDVRVGLVVTVNVRAGEKFNPFIAGGNGDVGVAATEASIGLSGIVVRSTGTCVNPLFVSVALSAWDYHVVWSAVCNMLELRIILYLS